MIEMPKNDIDIRERSPLALAFLGDGVLELLVRSRLVATSRLAPGALHREAAQVVSAKGQWDALGSLEPLLTADVVTEMSAVGGLLILAIGMNMMFSKGIKVGNFLPAVFIPMLYYTVVGI